MNVWVYLRTKEKEHSIERGLLGLEPVSLVIKRRRLRWFGHMERKDDTDWIKHCTVMELEGSKRRGRLRKT